MIQGTGRRFPVKQTISKPKAVGPEFNPWYWHPNRAGVTGAPSWFQVKLREFDPTLAVTWNPIREQYQVWVEKPRLQHPICQGWMLLFPIAPRELDERVFARLYAASSRKWGDGKRYFDRIAAEIERDRQRREAQRTQETRDIAGDYWDHTRIQVSMFGPSSGSKFANCHSE